MSFAELRKNKASIDQLINAAQAAGGGDVNQSSDDNFWKPEVDKAGNGYAVIRFLPAPEGEDLPWARYWSHGFKGSTGSWYIENCLTSLNGADCPVCEANSLLWNSGRDEDKEIARGRKRRLHYVSNIMVINDPSNPSNNGKVFQFKYGKKIFDKMMDVMNPSFEDEQPINPFDFWGGADFKLKIRNVEGYRNYDKSEFSEPSALLGGDDTQLEAVYNRLYSLADFTDPKNYKSYSDLKSKLNRVLGETDGVYTTAEAVSLDEQSPSSYEQSFGGDSAVRPAPAATVAPVSTSDDDDDVTSYFARLANS